MRSIPPPGHGDDKAGGSFGWTGSEQGPPSSPGLEPLSRRLLQVAGALSVVLILMVAYALARGDDAASEGSSQITEAEATAYARAVNLRASDFPKLHPASPTDGSEDNERDDRELARCAGATYPSPAIVDIESGALEREGPGEVQQVRSDVEVMPTVAVATRENAALRLRGKDCFARLLPSALARQADDRVDVSGVTVSSLPDLLPSAPGGFALRIAMTFTPSRSTAQEVAYTAASHPTAIRRVRAVIDLFAFRDGPAQVGFMAMGVGRPVPAFIERDTISLLYKRARAASPLLKRR